MASRCILFLMPYIYYPKNKSFSRNKTGFGMVTWEIAKQFAARGDEVYILTSTLCNSCTIEGVNIIGLSVGDLFKNAHYNKFLFYLFLLDKSGEKGRARLALFKNLLIEGYVSKVIKRINPDIIHIHGLGLSALSFINPISKLGKSIIITLHGINSLDENILISSYEREFEQKILKFLSQKNNVYVTYISSGIKNILKNKFKATQKDRFFLVPNGIDCDKFALNTDRKEIKKKYQVPINKKILLNVGSLGKRKNQIFILKTLNNMNLEVKNNVILYLIGEGPERENLENYIHSHKLKENVKLLGFKEGEELIDYYNMADLSVITSTSEGFGLPMIESFAAGVPVLTFSDLEAARDLYNKNCMILVKNRDINEFGEAIKKALNMNWNRSIIKDHAKKFSWEPAIDKYDSVYEICENAEQDKENSWQIKLKDLKW